MAKNKKKRGNMSSSLVRKELTDFYWNKYMNLFMSKYEWTGNDIDEEKEYYLMKKLWFKGTIAAFDYKGIKELGFAPYAPYGWNVYDFPVEVELINERGASFIPNRLLKVNEEAVICFIQKNHKSIVEMVAPFIHRIVEVEMVIKSNLKAHKKPWTIGVSPEDKDKAETIMENLENDEDYLFYSFENPQQLSVLNTGAPFIIDALQNYKQVLENEILTYLGIDNLGLAEKKEHFIVDEVESSKEVINNASDSFLEMMEDFCVAIRDVLGYDVYVKAKEIQKEKPAEEKDEEVIPGE